MHPVLREVSFFFAKEQCGGYIGKRNMKGLAYMNLNLSVLKDVF